MSYREVVQLSQKKTDNLQNPKKITKLPKKYLLKISIAAEKITFSNRYGLID